MKKTALVALLGFVALAPAAQAQVKGIEITPTIGYRFSGTLSSGYNDGSTGYRVESVKVPNALSYGLSFEYPLHPSANLEVLWSHQSSSIEANWAPPGQPFTTQKFADLKIDTIQIGGMWLSGRPRDNVRWYLDFLIGATILSPSDSNFNSMTRFSGSLGGGAKIYASDNIGVKLGARWMPVYINSSDSGYYSCGYYGCYTYYNTNYLNQFDLSAGLIIRF